MTAAKSGHEDHQHHDHHAHSHALEQVPARSSAKSQSQSPAPAHALSHSPSAPPDNPHQPPVRFTEAEQKQARRLTAVLILIAVFFVVELGGALAAHSVVLQADALHLLMDVFALAMSLMAMRLAVRRPTERFTFGMRRAEPVAAIFNGLLVLAATVEIVAESIRELTHPSEAPEANRMLVVASAALVVNGISAWLIHGAVHPHDHAGHAGHAGNAHVHHHEHEHDQEADAPARAQGHALNLRGAWLHLLGDTLCSVAALVAALIIRLGGPVIFDPLASFLVAIVLLLGATSLIRDATVVLLEAAPKHLPVDRIRRALLASPEVAEVHDLHVWTLGAGHEAITAHIRVAASARRSLGHDLSEELRAKFSVEYVTVQVEDVAATAP